MKFDLQQGFPAVTTKRLYFDAVKGELIGFLRGCDNAALFRDLKCNIWNANANDPGTPESPNKWLTNPNRKGQDDLGRIYGVQWRGWRGAPRIVNAEPTGRDESNIQFMAEVEYDVIDQVQLAVDTIKNDPTNRRIIINAWRPDEFGAMALPPCHVMYQFLVNVERKELNLCMYQRSCDSFLGVPFNIASASLFLSIIAKLTGYTPRWFTHFLADAHIYNNHIEQVNTMLSREPHALPKLVLSDREWNFDTIEPSDIDLQDYVYHGALSGAMAV